jgi:hypothetical protein
MSWDVCKSIMNRIQLQPYTNTLYKMNVSIPDYDAQIPQISSIEPTKTLHLPIRHQLLGLPPSTLQ